MESTTPLHILSLTAENILRLTAVHIEPAGNTIILGGENAEGKSSVLNCIIMGLEGAGKIKQPLHGDSIHGQIGIDLGDLIVTRTFTPSGDRVVVKSKATGKEFGSPQAMLNKLIGSISFDPLEFTRMKDKEQLERLRELVGIDTTLLDANRDTAFADRTDVNRRLKFAQAEEAAAALAIRAKDEPDKLESMDELSAELAEAQRVNKANTAERERLARLEGTLSEVVKAIATDESTVAEFETKLAEAKASLKSNHDRKTQGEGMIAAQRATVAELEDVLQQPIIDRMKTIEETNILKRAFDEHLKKLDVANALDKESRELTQKIAKLDETKRNRIKTAKYPVEGLELGEAGVMFEGIPFDQASSAEKIRVSMAIGLAMNPKLRVLIIRDGSLLDKNSLATIATMAQEHNAQVWIEKVSDGAEVQIVIEDGMVKEDRSHKFK